MLNSILMIIYSETLTNLLYTLSGGFIGAILGVIGTIYSSYYGPKELEKWKQRLVDKKIDGPRKGLLLKLLNDERFKDGRKLTTLTLYTGTSNDECRRLLIEIKARGIMLKSDNEEIEGWALIKNKPLDDS